MMILGPLMFCLANVLVVSVYISAIVFILPDFPTIVEKVFHSTVGTFFVVNILFNYFACAFTPPGSPEKCDDPGTFLGETSVVIDGRRVYGINSRLVIGPAVSYRYCRKCASIKPPRAHHDRYLLNSDTNLTIEHWSTYVIIPILSYSYALCRTMRSNFTQFCWNSYCILFKRTLFSLCCFYSISGKCVYHMDHYCPWMMNCVGYYNYRYFVLFLIYLTLGAAYAMSLTADAFYNMAIVAK